MLEAEAKELSNKKDCFQELTNTIPYKGIALNTLSPRLLYMSHGNERKRHGVIVCEGITLLRLKSEVNRSNLLLWDRISLFHLK